ncbi:hypothetical protein AB0M42_26175 [Streptomyces sp. NPDC051784]|uniref:hypothetical protein n=1 Tax=Streptomyces sp. NPDC051784 TaxID=3155805 RepID=UPI00343837B6
MPRALARAGTPGPEPATVDDIDRLLEELLRQDCRMPISIMACSLGLSPRAAGRRPDRPPDSVTPVLRCETPSELLGHPREVRFGAEAGPHRIDEVLRHLALDPALSLQDVTSGRHTVVGHALCRSAAGSTGPLRSSLVRVPLGYAPSASP